MELYHRDWGASYRDLGDRSAWGVPHRDSGDRIKSASHRDKIRVPGMLLTGILEIGVLEVLLIGVLLPSGPDNLAIGVPVGEKAYVLCSSSICRGYKERKDESFKD